MDCSLDIRESINAAMSAKFECLKNSSPGEEFLRRCGKNMNISLLHLGSCLYYPLRTRDHTSDVEMRPVLQLRNTLPRFCAADGPGTTITI